MFCSQVNDFYYQLNLLSNSDSIVEFLLTSGYTKYSGGSCRDFYIAPQKTKFVIDGDEVYLLTGIKVKVTCFSDSFIDVPMGILQNKAESNPNSIPYQILIPNGDGSYSCNKNGVLIPIINSNPDGLWVETIVVEPFEHFNSPQDVDYLCVDHYNMMFHTITAFIKDWFNKKKLGRSNNSFETNILKTICEVIDVLDVSPYDLTLFNFGWYNLLGHSGMVIIDFGGTFSNLNQYDIATERRMNKRR